MSGTMAAIIESIDPYQPIEPIPLPAVESPVLTTIIEYCDLYQAAQLKGEDVARQIYLVELAIVGNRTALSELRKASAVSGCLFNPTKLRSELLALQGQLDAAQQQSKAWQLHSSAWQLQFLARTRAELQALALAADYLDITGLRSGVLDRLKWAHTVGTSGESLLLALEWRVVNMIVALIDSGQQLGLVALSCRALHTRSKSAPVWIVQMSRSKMAAKTQVPQGIGHLSHYQIEHQIALSDYNGFLMMCGTPY